MNCTIRSSDLSSYGGKMAENGFLNVQVIISPRRNPCSCRSRPSKSHGGRPARAAVARGKRDDDCLCCPQFYRTHFRGSTSYLTIHRTAWPGLRHRCEGCALGKRRLQLATSALITPTSFNAVRHADRVPTTTRTSTSFLAGFLATWRWRQPP